MNFPQFFFIYCPKSKEESFKRLFHERGKKEREFILLCIRRISLYFFKSFFWKNNKNEIDVEK